MAMRAGSILFSVTVGAAAGVAYYFFNKSRKASADTVKPSAASKSAPAGKSGAAKKTDAPKNVKTGNYSFISGFKDAETVEFSFSYDADRFSFHVAEDEFLAESGDSHVGLLYGEDFNAQFEYGTYYSGEDFDRLRTELAGRHADLASVSFGAYSGVRYLDGDSLCLAFPIPEDAHSYLLITLFKAADNDDELSALADYPELGFMLSSMQFARS